MSLTSLFRKENPSTGAKWLTPLNLNEESRVGPQVFGPNLPIEGVGSGTPASFIVVETRKMTSNRKLGRKLRVGMALALAVTNVTMLPSRAFGSDRLPTDPPGNRTQGQMACSAWLTRTVPNFLKQRVIDLTYWPKGALSEEAALRARFEREPELWKWLEYTQGNRYVNYDNQISIFNTLEDMIKAGLKKTLGFCWGHATMRFYFTRLSFFDPRGLHEAIPAFREGSQEWVDFYKAKIRQIANGEPAVIPGFATLREFSEHPSLINWFRHHAADEWAERMASIFNAGAFLSKRDYTTKEGLDFIASLQERLAQGYNPKIIFDENSHKRVTGEQNSLHVVQVVGVHKLKNDYWAIEVLDDKFGAKKGAPARAGLDADDETEILYLNTKGGKDKKSTMGVYLPWRLKDMTKPFEKGNAWDHGGGNVNQFRLAPENDIEAMRMTLNMRAFCMKRPKVCEELGNRNPVQRGRPALQEAGGAYRPFEYPDEN